MANYSTHLTLLDRISTGTDPAAWQEFQDRYGRLIRSVARRRGLQDADCDEVVQEVLTSLSRAMPGFKYDPSKGMFRSYLKTITLRATFDKMNRQPGEVGTGAQVEPADKNHLEKIWELEWRQYHLRRAMKLIDEEFNRADRTAFEEYAIRGQPADETASRLNMTVDQVYQAKSRILKRLEMLIQYQVAEEG